MERAVREEHAGLWRQSLPLLMLVGVWVHLDGDSGHGVTRWPFPEPTLSLGCVQSTVPSRKCWATYSRRKEVQGQGGRESPEDFGLKGEIMGFGSKCIL